MLNRNRIIFSTLLLLTFIYAASVIGVSAHSSSSRTLIHKKKSTVYVVLKDRCGFTDGQIKRAREVGKNAFDLAREKGISEYKLKSLVYEEKCKRLDEKVKSGKITAEKAEMIKNKVKERIDRWDGSFKINKRKSEYNKNNENRKL